MSVTDATFVSSSIFTFSVLPTASVILNTQTETLEPVYGGTQLGFAVLITANNISRNKSICINCRRKWEIIMKKLYDKENSYELVESKDLNNFVTKENFDQELKEYLKK